MAEMPEQQHDPGPQPEIVSLIRQDHETVTQRLSAVSGTEGPDRDEAFRHLTGDEKTRLAQRYRDAARHV